MGKFTSKLEKSAMQKSISHPGEWRWEEDGITVTRTIGWSGPGCHSQCGLLVYSKDNRVLKVEGDPETPHSEGRLCLRCLALPKVVHHPDRLNSSLEKSWAEGRREMGTDHLGRSLQHDC